MTRTFAFSRVLPVAAMAVALTLTSCSTNLAAITALSPSVGGDSWSVTAIFSNALNLPSQAKVKLNGADIGEVAAISAKDFTARIGMRIRKQVSLYPGTTAELRSATPLGDVFVAIHPGPSHTATPALNDGATIPITATAAAASVEEVLGSAALLLNGGAVRHLVNIVNGAGQAVGGRGQNIADLLQQSNTLISRLARRSTQIDELLRSTTDLAATLAARKATLNEALAAAGPATAALAADAATIADLTDTVARITTQLSKFPSLQDTDTRSMIADLNTLSASTNELATSPELSMTALNRLIGILMKATNGTAAHANLEVPKLALGSLPDKNYPGDPGFHGPDGTDWHAMIGSLRYQWNVLLGKVLGSQR
ncbi:MlaD family protein [Mycobacteroides abscessus]|uniref:MlaD family protein n=1 Tax=Mycobacteroides abscessus TaxID=36809 RepID=UPI000C265DB1|nr:MlaD family protein [Mycobacteroides abscessus]